MVKIASGCVFASQFGKLSIALGYTAAFMLVDLVQLLNIFWGKINVDEGGVGADGPGERRTTWVVE